MGKPRSNHWECVGKFAFHTAALAKQVAKRMSQKKRGAALAYHCPTCNGWHVGSAMKKPKIKRRR